MERTNIGGGTDKMPKDPSKQQKAGQSSQGESTQTWNADKSGSQSSGESTSGRDSRREGGQTGRDSPGRSGQ